MQKITLTDLLTKAFCLESLLDLPPTVGLELLGSNRLVRLLTVSTGKSEVSLNKLTVPLIQAVKITLAVVSGRVNRVHGTTGNSHKTKDNTPGEKSLKRNHCEYVYICIMGLKMDEVLLEQDEQVREEKKLRWFFVWE